MRTLIVTLHVLTAVLLTGPLVLAPFTGLRAIRRRDATAVRSAYRQAVLFGAGSVLVTALGIVTVSTGEEYDFGAPWITIASTLYLVALLLTFGYLLPALRRAGKLAVDGAPGGRHAVDGSTVEDTGGGQPAPRQRLDALAARIGGAGVLLLALYAAITVLMVWRPFQD